MLFISRAAKKLRIYSDIWARHKGAFELFSVQIEKRNA